MTKTINTTHEDNARPAYDAAKSALAKAQDNVVKEREALSKAQATLSAFNAKLDSSETLPKNAAHDGGELEAAVSFHSKRVKRAEQAVREAQAEQGMAHYVLTEAKVLDRAEAIAAFDYDELAAEFAAEVQEVADRYLGRVHDLSEAEVEAFNLGQSIELDGLVHNPEARVRLQRDTGRFDIVLDGRKLYSVYPSLGLSKLRESIRDTRQDAKVAEARRAEAERRAEEEGERKAEREMMEAYRQAERRGELPLGYLGGTPGSPIVTRDQFGRPLNPMTSTPNGSRTATFR